MKKNFLFALSFTMLLASCGGQNAFASSDPVPGSFDPVFSDSLTSDESTAGWTEEMFYERLVYLDNHKEELSSDTYTKQTRLRDSEYGEQLVTHYSYQKDNDRGIVMIGEAELRDTNGVLDFFPLDGSGYDYDIQSYEEGGFIHYIEKVPSNIRRVSYDSVTKKNRYNGIFTTYSGNPDLVVTEDLIKYMDGKHGTAKVKERGISANGHDVKWSIIAEEFSSYTGYMYRYFGEIHANTVTKQLTSLQTGFYVYEVGQSLEDENSYVTVRKDTVTDFVWGGHKDYTGSLLTENDVDKVYGPKPQHLIDYSSWNDGILDDEKGAQILSNLQAYAYGTTSTQTEFTLNKFVDPQHQTGTEEDAGGYIIMGKLRGSAVSKLYQDDFVETTGTASLVSEDSAQVGDEIALTIQAEANEEGMHVIADYSSAITSHKHTWKANEVEDTDPYIGVNPIFRSEVFHPSYVAGAIGVNCSEESPLDDDNNSYTSAGSLIKSGNTITGKMTKIYHRNVWTPYWTYAMEFKIEDNFLSELSLDVSSYYETDDGGITFDSSVSFLNRKGEEVKAYEGTKLDLEAYEEGHVLAKNERLFM